MTDEMSGHNTPIKPIPSSNWKRGQTVSIHGQDGIVMGYQGPYSLIVRIKNKDTGVSTSLVKLPVGNKGKELKKVESAQLSLF